MNNVSLPEADVILGIGTTPIAKLKSVKVEQTNTNSISHAVVVKGAEELRNLGGEVGRLELASEKIIVLSNAKIEVGSDEIVKITADQRYSVS